MHPLLQQVRETLAAGESIEDLLDQLDRQLADGGSADRAEQLTGLTEQFQAVAAERDAARALAESALGRYRTARAEALGVSADLLPGATLEDIEAAAGRAQELVAAIESRVRGQIAAATVPAGDGGRTPPDLAELPPVEKIKLGLLR